MNKTVEKFKQLPEDLQKLLKATFIQCEWGDTQVYFTINDEIRELWACGYCTNDVRTPLFKGRKKSAAFRRIYQILGCDKNGNGAYITHVSDWWGDGSGDMLFIKANDYEEVMKWAQEK